MVATALRQEVIDYVDMLDEERMEMLHIYVKTLAEPTSLSNSKSPEERREAVKAFAELENMTLEAKKQESMKAFKKLSQYRKQGTQERDYKAELLAAREERYARIG